MTYSPRTSKKKTLRVLGLILVLSLLLAISGGSAGASTRLGTPDSLGPASAGAQGDVHTMAPNVDWDWPQVQRDPQRTGYTPEVLGTDFQVAWAHRFHPEKVHPQVQAIVSQGNVYAGTEHGNVYAFDARTGEQQWVYPVGAPVLASVACSDGKVFFGAMDGAVYALDATTGSLVWRSDVLGRYGFSTAPVLAENRVMLGGRNGVFYALDLDGNTLWQHDAGAPILQTAAYNDGRVFFGAMDMHVYALNTSDGSLSWRSERLYGMALKDYWPVVHQDYVLVRAMGYIHPDSSERTFYALDEDTGEENIILPQFDGKTMNGATTPPAVGRDGSLVVPIPRPGGGYGACWGLLDLATQEVVDELEGGEGGGCGNNDENENVSCAHNLIIGMHTGDAPAGAGYEGAFDLDHRSWIDMSHNGAYVPLQPRHNTQGGGGSPVSIANGMFYHMSHSHLYARTTQP